MFERIEAIGQIEIDHMGGCGNGMYTTTGFTVGGVFVPVGKVTHVSHLSLRGRVVCAIRRVDGDLRLEAMEVSSV